MSKKNKVKNSYIRNIGLLLIFTIASSTILLCSCGCNESCCCKLHLSLTIENIIIGLFSSSLLLLLMEIFQLVSDKHLYGYLEGKYIRTIITNVITNSDIVTTEKREEDLNDFQKKKFIDRNLIPIPGSRYVEILDYRNIGKDWKIDLKYFHHGIYEGTAEYHKYWENDGNKTIVKFTLTLNQFNLTTGSGSYKYVEKDDYGIYTFQVNENDKDEILVTYKNAIPSGLSEGYEKWKRTK